MQENMIPRAGLKIAIIRAIAETIDLLRLKNERAKDFLRALISPNVMIWRASLIVTAKRE